MSDQVHPIEQHIIEVTGFVPEKQYRKRQALLGAYLKAVCDLSNDDYEKLDERAAEWSIKAAEIHKTNKERIKDGKKPLDLPDFDDEENGIEDESEITSHEEQLDQDESSEIDTLSEADANVDQDTSDEEPKKAPKKRGRKPGTKVAKTAKPKKESKGRQPPRGTNPWGVVNGTKSDLVCRMLAQEGGTTMKDIKEATGQTHYNLVHRLNRHQDTHGYKIVKDGENLRLIPRD